MNNKFEIAESLAIAVICYAVGVIAYAAINIYLLKRKYPDEASQIKILTTYWKLEWANFYMAAAGLLILICLFPWGYEKALFGYPIKDNYPWMAIFTGVFIQMILVLGFGVTKKVLISESNRITGLYGDKTPPLKPDEETPKI